MDQRTLDDLLADLPLGPMRYFDQVGSTNDLAIRWASAGAADLSVIVADEQIAGRGRLNQRWFTPPGSALAFSLVLRPENLPLEITSDAAPGEEQTVITRLTALGALAVCETLNQALLPMLPAQIKWPNDVIATRRKLAGVLVETEWSGDKLDAAIIGIGVNVSPQAVPPLDGLSFPATCVEEVIGDTVDRWALLQDVLANFLHWKERLTAEEFMHAWLGRLAFRGEWVLVLTDTGTAEDTVPIREGQVSGLDPDGSLRLQLRSGEMDSIQFGEIRLRPADSQKT